ncbi:acyl-CoA reductase [Pseudomonas citronellolis]|uniref:acyl-CoA reductase n=1 Tax=Pseudomonas citronellolis TaxID=53408 RepID=UPI0021C12D20|nr:acyl-CoA reductase [Pseudomonas citronellolis]UXJ50268.1 long-chain-fatty-acyl-CoA reductase [Pseudomonas citronellolis]
MTYPFLVPHMIKGQLFTEGVIEYALRDRGHSLATPALELDQLIWPRTSEPPAANLPIEQVIDFLVAVGERLNLDSNPYLRQALDDMTQVSELGPRVLENCYRDLRHMFQRSVLEAELECNLGSKEVIDGWQSLNLHGMESRRRAYPPRLVHVLAGNSPMAAAMTVIRGALTKGVHLLKMPSNDPFTATAILGTMADIHPDHPVTRSFSAVYWRGGDAAIESVLYRAQHFDKLVVWGGESAARHAQRYIDPGLDLVSFAPKVSMSMVGREAFTNDATLRDVARRAATDVLSFNQGTCKASRYQFVEGDSGSVDLYCRYLAEALQQDVRYGNGHGAPTPKDIREKVDSLKLLEPVYRVFGSYDGKGLVIRSEEPVDLHPNSKTINVVPVGSLTSACRFATAATQTVGIWPAQRRTEVRDALANAGVQRIVTLGAVNGLGGFGGTPHGASYSIHRLMRWISDEGED